MQWMSQYDMDCVRAFKLARCYSKHAEGMVAIVKRKLAVDAGNMISEITLAMVNGVGLGKIANVIHPYPTQAEAIKRLGDAYQRTRLTPRARKWFARWFRWNQ